MWRALIDLLVFVFSYHQTKTSWFEEEVGRRAALGNDGVPGLAALRPWFSKPA